MEQETLSSLKSYNPNNLLNELIERMELTNDAALSRALAVRPPVISKICHFRVPVTALMLIRMHEVTDISIKEVRTLMGDHYILRWPHSCDRQHRE